MARKTDLTQEYLHSILDYNSNSGVFIWKYRKDVPSSWNANYSGKTTGWKHSNGYMQTCINYKKYFLHRLAWFYVYGIWPKEIDHIDRDKKNNRISNLRILTHRENCNNRKQRQNPSGYKGITQDYRDGVWQASITLNGKTKYLGRFSSAVNAATAYNLAKEIYA